MTWRLSSSPTSKTSSNLTALPTLCQFTPCHVLKRRTETSNKLINWISHQGALCNVVRVPNPLQKKSGGEPVYMQWYCQGRVQQTLLKLSLFQILCCYSDASIFDSDASVCGWEIGKTSPVLLFDNWIPRQDSMEFSQQTRNILAQRRV